MNYHAGAFCQAPTGGCAMRLVDEMPPKLQLIRQLAKQRFNDVELHQRGLHFGPNGEVDIDYADPSNQIQAGGQAWWEDEESRRNAIDQGATLAAALHRDVEELCARFESYYDLDPLDLTGVVGMIGGRSALPDGDTSTVAARIAYAYKSYVSKVDDLIEEEHWSGEAAREFKSQYLDLFEGVWVNQQETVRALGIVASAFHKWVETTVQGLLLVADQCIHSLGGPAVAITEEARNKNILIMSWGSLIFAVVGFFPPIAVPAGVTSVYLAVHSMFIEPNREVRPNPIGTVIEGNAAQEVIRSTQDMITAIEAHIAAEDAEFAAALDNELTGKHIVKSPALSIVPYAMQGNPDIGRLPGDDRTDVPIERNYVVVEIGQLYQAGRVNLAGAAAQYAQAATDLAWSEVRGSSTRLFPRSAGAYNSGRELMVSRLGETREGLSIAAEALMRPHGNTR